METNKPKYMKFSERFFRFPVKIYDGISVRKVIKQELEKENPEDVDQPAWAQGDVKIPYSSLNKLYYHEGFTPGRDMEDVVKNGFDLTTVYHSEFGDFDCLWTIDKFEKKLDEFVEQYEAYLETLMPKE